MTETSKEICEAQGSEKELQHTLPFGRRADEALRRQRVETVLRGSKRVESLLEERLGATGRGLHEKVSSVEHRLPPEVSRSMRWIATLRNKIVHEDAPAAFDTDEFAARVDEAVEWLTLNADLSPGTRLAEVGQSSATTADGIEPRSY